MAKNYFERYIWLIDTITRHHALADACAEIVIRL